MSLSAALLFFVMVACGFTVTGIVGFGAHVLMMPILSMVYPIGDLVLIFALISFVNSFFSRDRKPSRNHYSCRVF